MCLIEQNMRKTEVPSCFFPEKWIVIGQRLAPFRSSAADIQRFLALHTLLPVIANVSLCSSVRVSLSVPFTK